MKIGILTLPLNNNYGGILQCYALKEYLRLKFDAEIFIVKKNEGFVARAKKYFFYLKKKSAFPEVIHKNFIRQNFRVIESKCVDKCVDIIFAGSDQVWRKDFFPRFFGYFFCDFLPVDTKVKRVAYAASFGVDIWQYSVTETAQIKKWLKGYDGVSVRESSAVELCNKYLGINPTLVIDPTMLLKKRDYEALVDNNLKSEVFIYWLGKKEDLDRVKNIVGIADVKIVHLKNATTLCSVGEWISYMKNSSRIITDSFHGCVFSILFNKQFVVCDNVGGGVSRIDTLLSSFNICHRRVVIDEIAEYLDTPLDYSAVNSILDAKRQEATEFINRCV